MALAGAPASQQEQESAEPQKQRMASEEQPTGALAEKSGGAAPSKHRIGFEDEGMVPGAEEEGKPRNGGGLRAATVRGASMRGGYMTPKGRVSRGFAVMTERDALAEKEQKRADTSRRLTARRSARNTSNEAKLRPIVTSRPKPQRWNKQPDDWKRESKDAEAFSVDRMWAEAEKEMRATAGRPPTKQIQSHALYGSQREMTERERAYQLESQIAARERMRLTALREKQKEKLANEKLAQDQRGMEWYRKQKERQISVLQKHERKDVQKRLYAALPARGDGRVYG